MPASGFITGNQAVGLMVSRCSPPEVDRIWGAWGSSYNIPKALFYLLNGGLSGFGFWVKRFKKNCRGTARAGSNAIGSEVGSL